MAVERQLRLSHVAERHERLRGQRFSSEIFYLTNKVLNRFQEQLIEGVSERRHFKKLVEHNHKKFLKLNFVSCLSYFLLDR
jgi:hypothetical protein